jgi:phosphatidylethanolamine/phosphatidyl-N-methylethanolamine N-methyltransferase
MKAMGGRFVKYDLARLINRKFADELEFLKQWRHDKEGVGALFPTSVYAARSMARAVDPRSRLPVLELGAGTGSITKSILDAGISPEMLVAVEYSDAFCRRLEGRFPGVIVVHGDVFNLDRALGRLKDAQFDCVISALPLLNFPILRRINLVKDLLSRIPHGRPVVQISYGPLSPIPESNNDYVIKHHELVWRNAPPAQVWRYSKPL